MNRFVPAPREHADHAICSAIETHDYRNARRLIDKRLSKTESPYLHALKFFIGCHETSIIERAFAAAQLRHLSHPANQGRVPIDIDVLDIYDEGLKVLAPQASEEDNGTLCLLRTAAVRLAPKDEQLALACFRACLARSDFEAANKVAKSLQVHFPNDRKYAFWAICTLYLASQKPVSSMDELKSRHTFAKLAMASITKVALNTVNANTTSAVKIQTPEELLLLQTIMLSVPEILAEKISAQDQQDVVYMATTQTLKLCSMPELNPTSSAAKGTWALQINEIRMLRQVGMWQQLFEKCGALLAAAAPGHRGAHNPRGNDWLVWDNFIEAGLALANTEVYTAIETQLRKYIGHEHFDRLLDHELDKTYFRNASLAMLKYKFALASPNTGDLPMTGWILHKTPSESFSVRCLAVYLFLYQQAAKPSTFGDIRLYVEQFEWHEITHFFHIMMAILTKNGVFFGGSFSSAVLWPHLTDDVVDRHPDTPVLSAYARDELNGKPRRTQVLYAELSSFGKLHATVTFYKLEFMLKISNLEMELIKKEGHGGLCAWCGHQIKYRCAQCLGDIAFRAIRAYGSAINDDNRVGETLKPTDTHPADGMLIVAAMCLIKMSSVDQENPRSTLYDCRDDANHRLLQAAALLEYGYEKSKANHQFSLLLVRLYVKLGLGALAVRAYLRLGLKQIQNDTLSYVLFDRISSLHPHPVQANTVNNMNTTIAPSKLIQEAQGIYRKFRAQVCNNASKAFEYGSYNSVSRLYEASTRIESSVTTNILIRELKRIKWITSDDSLGGCGFDTLSVKSRVVYSNNSDTDSFPDCEHSGHVPFEVYTRAAPGPSSVRCLLVSLTEQMWSLVEETEPSTVTYILSQLNTQANKDVANLLQIEDTTQYITNPEDLLFNGVMYLMELVVELAPKVYVHEGRTAFLQSRMTEIREIINHFQKELVKIQVNGAKWIPSFMSTLHPLYTAHEFASLICAVAKHLELEHIWDRSNEVTWASRDLDVMGKNLMKDIVTKAVKVEKRTRQAPTLDFVLDTIRLQDRKHAPIKGKKDDTAAEQAQPDLVGSAIEKLCEDDDTGFLEVFASDVVNSWRESVIGLVCLK